MPKAIKASQLLTATALTLFSVMAAAQQMKEDIRLPKPKRFIDKVEILIGPSLHFPDDNGWSERVNRESLGLTTHNFSKKYGHSWGITLIHSIKKRFEVHGRILWERKGYNEKSITKGDNSNIYKYEGDVKNDYVTLSVMPTFYFDKEERFFISSGLSYNHLLKSLRIETQYLNGQKTQVTSTILSPETIKYGACIVGEVGYSLSIYKRMQLTTRLQGQYGLTDIINVNGLVINSNSLSLLICIKYNR